MNPELINRCVWLVPAVIGIAGFLLFEIDQHCLGRVLVRVALGSRASLRSGSSGVHGNGGLPPSPKTVSPNRVTHLFSTGLIN